MPQDMIMRTRRWFRILAAVVLLLPVLVFFLPALVAGTGILSWLLNGKLAPHEIQASIGQAQVGWFVPTAFRQVRVADVRDRWEFTVAELGSELSLWQMLMSGGDLGTFVIERPTIVVTVDPAIEWPKFQAAPEPSGQPVGPAAQRFRIRIRDGTILVRLADQPQPQELARQISLQADWQKTANGPVLTIAAGKPLDHVQLTPEICDTGLKYVAPIFADVAWSRGTLSLELDQCQIPLDRLAAAQAQGRVALHAVETGLKNPLAKDIARLVTTLTRRNLPEAVRVADNSVIDFQVHDARVHHSGLEFGLPEVAPELVIRTQGIVGFDGTLDLLAEIPLPLSLLGDGPIAQSLGNQTLNLPVRGTLDQPQLSLEGNGQLASAMISKLLDPLVSGETTVEDVVEALRAFRAQRQQRREERGPLLPRLRERRRDD
jgi:hypothetical protein